MTKKELINKIAVLQKKEAGLPDKDVELAVKVLIEHVSDCLAAGNRVEIRGFGGFEVNERPARIGRNPKTGKKLMLNTSKIIQFKAGKNLRDSVNASATFNK